MAIVYAPQEPMTKNLLTGLYERNPRYNLSALDEYGHVTFVWPVGSQVWAKYEVKEHALKTARAFDDQNDWVVNVGSPTLMFLLGWAIGHVGKELRILEWDGRINNYVPIILQQKG